MSSGFLNRRKRCPSAFRASLALFARHYPSGESPESLYARHVAWRERFAAVVAAIARAERRHRPHSCPEKGICLTFSPPFC